MDLTVAICTYQRRQMLRQTLESLLDCESVSLDWELLVVDNAGDQQVERMVSDMRASGRSLQPHTPLRYVVEESLGTSYARNRAVREAQAPVILFTDDDVTFDRRWLARMARSVREHDDCDFWGGRVEPVWTVPAPYWFDPVRCPMLGDCIVQYQRGREPRYWDANDDPPFYTANLAMRVERVVEAGYFDTSVGHRGGVRVGAEDSLMVRAIAGAGGRGWYAADAVVYHPVPPERLTRRFARRFAWRQGNLSVEMVRRGSDCRLGHDGPVPKWLYRVAVGQVLLGAGGWLGGVVRADPAQRFAGQLKAWFNLAKLCRAGVILVQRLKPKQRTEPGCPDPEPVSCVAELDHSR